MSRCRPDQAAELRALRAASWGIAHHRALGQAPLAGVLAAAFGSEDLVDGLLLEVEEQLDVIGAALLICGDPRGLSPGELRERLVAVARLVGIARELNDRTS